MRLSERIHSAVDLSLTPACCRLIKELGPLDEATICTFIRQVTTGLKYLHALGIAHRDLKCANLLLGDGGVVKIADFGTAKQASSVINTPSVEGEDDEDALDTARYRIAMSAYSVNAICMWLSDRYAAYRSVREGLGSPYWMAPELVRAEKGEDAWQKTDVWAIGCIVIEMATGKPPWVSWSCTCCLYAVA